MACGGCGQARGVAMAGLRAGSVRGVMRGVAMGVAVNYDKLRGTYSDAKYTGTNMTPVVEAKPYKRPEPERTR